MSGSFDYAQFFALLFALFFPLTIVAFGGMFSERSGIINLGLEGIMVIGSFFGCLFVAAFNKNINGVDTCIAPGLEQLIVFGGILVAMVSGVLMSLLLAFACINLKANQTIVGTSLNILAPALGIVLIWSIQSNLNTTITIPSWCRIGYKIPFSPNTFQDFIFSNLYLTSFVIFFLFILLTFVFYKTKLGLRLRACGENPQAADSVGINVKKMRYIGTMIGGGCAAIGGMGYVLITTAGYKVESGVSGYGFLALAVMIFGNWKPFGVLGAGLFFTFFRILATNLNIEALKQINGSGQIYSMIPYIVTIIVLVLFSKHSRAPKAEGIPYDKGARS